MRITPAITLSALLLSGFAYGTDWTITNTETKTLNGALPNIINGVELTGNGNLTVNSTGNNTINDMQMFWLSAGAGANFNVNGGSLSLDLELLNSNRIENTVNFNVKNGAALTLTAGQNGGNKGVFTGINTQLTANIASGGTLTGLISNDGETNITISQGGTLDGNITQTSGTIEARLEGSLQGSLIIRKNTTKKRIWAYNAGNTPTVGTARITGNIIYEGKEITRTDAAILQQEQLEGILKGIQLSGSFTQTGGQSDIAFHHSQFQSNTTLSDAITTMHFYSTSLKSITATNGSTTINLKGDQGNHTNGSTMENYTGNNGNSTITLVEESSMQAASQNGGSLTIDATNSQIKGSITGSNSSILSINLDQKSKITGSITNTGGRTNIDLQDSEITGSISQTGGRLKIDLKTANVGEKIVQNGGALTYLNAQFSTISQGLELTKIGQNGVFPQIIFKNSTITNGGIRISNAINTLSGTFTNNSQINGGYDQTGRKEVSLDFDGSTLSGGVRVRDGGGISANGNISNAASHATSITFQNGSTLDGEVISNNHSIWFNFTKNSKAQNGGFSVTGGDFYLVASENSTVSGNLTSQDTGETRLYLSGATFIGNINQTNGKQHISMVLTSTLKGDIQNSGTESVFANDEGSTLTGSYTQTDGELTMLLGGDSTIQGNISLTNVNTKLGNGTAKVHSETIKGNFIQNNGTLTGNIEGLTLEGKFTQNDGTSDITFEDADFKQETTIDNATLSQILFDNSSNLKTTTLNNSTNPDNTFTLDHTTILEGNFNLNHSKVTLGVKNGSKITGNITASDPDSDLDFDFEGDGNEIGGDITISNGNTGGEINGTTISGDFILTDATSHFHITNSNIRGEIKITRGNTMMTLDNTSVGKNFTMNGVDKNPNNHPTLKLRIGNGSSIAGDLSFIDTEAFLGGFGDNNRIGGNLIISNSTITNGGAHYAGGTGDPDTISNMNIAGNIQQTGGISDLSFIQNSTVTGNIQIQNATQSHLSFSDASSIHAINVQNSLDTIIAISNLSTQDNGINFDSSQATISATDQSTITSDITVKTTNNNLRSEAKILLDASNLIGKIEQTDGGTLLMQYSNNSSMNGTTTTNTIDSLDINLDSSSIIGHMTLSKTPTHITMQNNSSITGDFTLINNQSFVLDSDHSNLSGSINHNGSSNNGYEIILNFKNNSTFENPNTSINGNMQISSSDSQITSQEILLLNGKFDLSLNHSTGNIGTLSTAGSNSISVSATNSTDFSINTLSISDNANLLILGQAASTLQGQINLQKTSKTTISSLSNAILKFDIIPENTISLDIGLNGGIFQGKIEQNQPIIGRMTLGTNGGFGGRWIATDNSAINSVSISNSSANVTNRAMMQANSYNTAISLIDTTRNMDNTSRVGLSIINNGIPTDTQTLARTIRVGNLSGINGVFRVYTDIGAEISDKISTSTASGNHIIQAYYNPATFTSDIANRYIVLAHVDDAQTTANFQGGEVDMGNQTYKTSLIKVTSKDGVGFDWILGSTQNLGPTYGTKVISSILQSQYRSYAIQTESLRQRMGELRDINRVHGLWGRYNMGSNYTAESDVGVEIIDNYYNAWIGYDQNVLDLKGQNFYGVALSYALVAPEGEDYQGQIHNFGINLYDTFIARNDFYMDFVLKYILTYADYEIDYYSLAKNKPSYFNHKVMLSAEFGKKFKLTDSKSYFFLQPEGQITAGYIFGNTVSFTDASQTTIEANLSGDAPVILRTGLTAGYSLNSSSFKADFYAGTSIFYETSTGGDVELNDGNSTVSYNHKGDFRMSIQGGFDLIFNDNARVYFEAGTSFMGPTQNVYSINAGARFAFGYKNTRKLKVPSSTPPPPPPKTEYDPRNIPVITDNTSEDIRNNNSAKPRKQGYDSDYFINTRKFYRDRTSVANNPKPTY